MPSINGLLETALYVDDLNRAQAFYQEILGFVPLYSDRRMRAFDVAGRQVLLLFLRGASAQMMTVPGGTIPPHDGSGPIHVAFAVSADDFSRWEEHLRDHGIEIEGRTEWKRGGRSLYFRDPDGHLLELATPGLWAIY